jgi:hypothetical protein
VTRGVGARAEPLAGGADSGAAAAAVQQIGWYVQILRRLFAAVGLYILRVLLILAHGRGRPEQYCSREYCCAAGVLEPTSHLSWSCWKFYCVGLRLAYEGPSPFHTQIMVMSCEGGLQNILIVCRGKNTWGINAIIALNSALLEGARGGYAAQGSATPEGSHTRGCTRGTARRHRARLDKYLLAGWHV